LGIKPPDRLWNQRQDQSANVTEGTSEDQSKKPLSVRLKEKGTQRAEKVNNGKEHFKGFKVGDA